MTPENETEKSHDMNAPLDEVRQKKDKVKKPSFNVQDILALNDYYRIKKLPAARFLGLLKKNKVSKLLDEDIQSCMIGLSDRDPEFIKTLDLIYRATGNQSPAARQCVTFASQACRKQLTDHYGIELDMSAPANDLFEGVLRCLMPGLTAKQIDNRALNVLKAVGIWLGHSRNLNEIKAVSILTNGLISKGVKGNSGIPYVFWLLFSPTNKINAMADILRVARHGFIEAECARESEAREKQQREIEVRRAQEYLEQLMAARSVSEEKDKEIAELTAKVTKSEREMAILEQKIEHGHAISLHGKGEIKGRTRVFLENKLLPLLETAHEFAELVPPRTNIILERLEMAREVIRREIEWLRSTD